MSKNGFSAFFPVKMENFFLLILISSLNSFDVKWNFLY